MGRRRRIFLAAFAALIGGILAARFMPKPLPELSRAEFLSEVRAGHVRKVVVRDNDVIIATSTTRGEFRTAYNRNDSELIAQLRALGLEIVCEDSGLGLI